MRPTKRTQPYRKRPARPPTKVLDAMKRGKTAFGQNPQHRKRGRRRLS